MPWRIAWHERNLHTREVRSVRGSSVRVKGRHAEVSVSSHSSGILPSARCWRDRVRRPCHRLLLGSVHEALRVPGLWGVAHGHLVLGPLWGPDWGVLAGKQVTPTLGGKMEIFLSLVFEILHFPSVSGQGIFSVLQNILPVPWRRRLLKAEVKKIPTYISLPHPLPRRIN